MNITLARRFGAFGNVAEKRFIGIDEYTKLMLHLDNNITDSSSEEVSVTANSLTYTELTGWGYYANLDGSNSYCTFTPPQLTLNDDEGDDTTIDYRLKYASAPSGEKFIVAAASSESQWLILAMETSGKIRVALYDGSNNPYADCSTNVCDDEWHHVALVISGGYADVYIDGVREIHLQLTVSTVTISEAVIGARFINYNNKATCSIDEFRWSNIARYTSDFTPQTTPYVGN